MGTCASTSSKHGPEVSSAERCPTVFDLRREIEKKRCAASRLHVNLVHIEFLRSLYEIYEKGPKILTRNESARMFAVTHKVTGRTYAVRELAIPANRDARIVKELWEGFDRQASLDHANICRLHEIYCSEERYYIVTDNCSGGNLIDRLKLRGQEQYAEPEAADLVRKIAGALHHCHTRSIVHGDLRVEACLFENTGAWSDIRVVGAGRNSGTERVTGRTLSNSRGTDGSSSIRRSNKNKKAVWYMAPELRRGEPVSLAGDMWTLGVVAYMALMGVMPQPGISEEAARTSIMVGKPSFKGRGWGNRSPEARDFVARLLQKDPLQRMTSEEAMAHPWIRSRGRVEGSIAPTIHASLTAYKDSYVMRRLGLLLVGRTLESTKIFHAKDAFRSLDIAGKGYITVNDLQKGLRGIATTHHLSDSMRTGGVDDDAFLAHVEELFASMDPEGTGRAGFSVFVAACLAGRPADEAGSRVAFGWLDRRRKEAITVEDVCVFTGQVLPRGQIEKAFSDAHDALDEMNSVHLQPGVGAAARETERRLSASSGSAGGFSYKEFYRLLAAVPAARTGTRAQQHGHSLEDRGKQPLSASLPCALGSSASSSSEAGGEAAFGPPSSGAQKSEALQKDLEQNSRETLDMSASGGGSAAFSKETPEFQGRAQSNDSLQRPYVERPSE